MSSIPSVVGRRMKFSMVVLTAATLNVLAACALLVDTEYPAPPETRVAMVVDTIHGVAIPDPYRWLDDQNSPETRAWIDAQNAYAEQIVGQTPVRAWLEQRLRPLLDVEDVGTPRRAGDYQYFTLRRRGDEVASIYRRPAPPPEETGPIDPAGEYEKVIDALSFAADGTTSVEPVTFSSDGKLMVYHVRDGGPDEIEIRIRDLESGVDLPDRLAPALYSSISFSRDGRGIYYVRRGRADGDGSRAYFHVLGTDVSQDQLLFGEKYGPSTYVDVSEVADGRYLLFAVRHGWARSELHVLDRQAGGGVRPIVEDADARFYHEFIDGLLYVRTNLDADRNRVLAIDLANPARENWREVIPESEDVLEDFTLIDGKWYVTYLHDASNRIRVFEKDGTPAGEVEVPEFHSASIRSGRDGEALLTLTSFTTPSTVYRIDLATGERTVYEPPEVEWDGSPYTVSQVWRTSKDGTRAPMFIVHRRDIELNGQNPTLLTGYGGFYVARKPSFNTTAALWLDLGGVFALATLRGGSEYGEAWHRAGMLENKQNVFDDFISAAEWLIENDYTSPDKLAIQGGSNGGLLVGAALTQRPDLYRAVLIGFPDVDILRFFQHHGSNSPPALLEYGNSAIPSQFEAIRKYSPLQNVREGVAYPAVMFNTGDLDTRVPPLGARKMTAALQAASTSGHPVILSYSPRAGHAGGRPFSQRLKLTAMQMAFLIDQLDMEVPIDTTP